MPQICSLINNYNIVATNISIADDTKYTIINEGDKEKDKMVESGIKRQESKITIERGGGRGRESRERERENMKRIEGT